MGSTRSMIRTIFAGVALAAGLVLSPTGALSQERAKPAAAGERVREARLIMQYSDATRLGTPWAKDPSVVRFGNRFLMYYTVPAPRENPAGVKDFPKGLAIGIAESRDLKTWTKIGEILPRQQV